MSLAIAYAMKKKKKCMAEGGMPEDMVEETSTTMSPIAKGMKKAFKTPGYAEGGNVKGVHKAQENLNEPGTSEAGFENARANFRAPMAEKYGNPAYKAIADEHRHASKREHHKVLEEMHEMKGHDRKYLAEGGEVEEMASGYEPMPCEKCGHMAGHAIENQGMGEEEDMIGRIMKKHMYSKGGKVSNEDMPIADSEPAEFDDMEKDDDLEFHDTAANSGDEDGDMQEDEDRKDVVSRIMKSRKKKDKMPHPA